jgi:hypothetical protein
MDTDFLQLYPMPSSETEILEHLNIPREGKSLGPDGAGFRSILLNY